MKAMWAIGAVAALAGCSTQGWRGAESEKSYDAELERVRQTAVINNDDYYEIHKDGKIYVLADAKGYTLFLQTGDIPLRVTEIGGGPHGETLVFAIASPEKNKKDGFGAVEMYKGRREGAAKDFYAEVLQNDQYYVFGDWASLSTFRKTGNADGQSRTIGRDKVTTVGDANALTVRFQALHAG